jgi:hypothetical protein
MLMNAPKASYMTCAMDGMWFLNAGHSIPEASRVDCSMHVIKEFEGALSVVIPSKQPSVSSTRSSRAFKYIANRAPVCEPLTYHSEIDFESAKE